MLEKSDSANSAAADAVKASALLEYLAAKTGLAADQTLSPSLDYEWTTATRADLRLPIQHALRPLESLRGLSTRLDIPIMVSTSPVPWQVTEAKHFPSLEKHIATSTSWPVTTDTSSRILQTVCQQQSLEFCDATNAFRTFAQPEKLFAQDSTQLSEWGNTIYAREIASTILNSPTLAAAFIEKPATPSDSRTTIGGSASRGATQ